MKPYYEHACIAIYHGDCLDVLRAMLAESVTAVVTDPPYALNFMGKGWDKVLPPAEVWAECLRVAKPGSMLLAFGGTRTYHRLTCSIEDAGWDVRDCLMWLYGSGFPKSLDVSKAIDKAAGAKRKVGPVDPARSGRLVNQGGDYETEAGWSAGNRKVTVDPPATDAARLWDGWGTSLKPSWEPIILAMKPLDGTFVANALEHGVAGLNVDGCRIPSGPDHAEKCASVVGLDSNRNVTAYGEWKGKRVDSHSPLGRWPANLILDEQAAAMLDEQSERKMHGAGYARPPKENSMKKESDGNVSFSFFAGGCGRFGDHGGASRFFYTAKADKADRSSNGFAKNNHPTVKPTDLMRWLVRLVTMPEGTIILDPFMGSGSTIVAAREEYVSAIGIEIGEKYCEITANRLAQEVLDFS